MKSKFIIIILMLITISDADNSYASNGKRFRSADAKITIQVKDTAALKYPHRFSVMDDYILFNIGARTTIIEANKKGEYIFRLKDLVQKKIIIISCDELKLLISNYLEPGDDITIVCNKLEKPTQWKNYTISYSGKGSEKFVASAMISSAEPKNLLRRHNTTFLNKSMIDTILRNADSTYAFKMRILNRFKNKINQHIFNKMQADLYGSAYDGVYSYLRTTFTAPNHYDILAAFYDEYENKLTLNIEEQWNSYSYLKFLADKTRARYQLRAGDKRKKFKAVYDLIISGNTGMTREKLLLFYLLNPLSVSGSEDPNLVYLDALQYVKTPKYSIYISDLAKAVNKGAMAYNFKLSDESGKLRSLSEFKGKLVLLDCWFTGCNNCSMLAKKIEQEVLPYYKDNEDIVFISINVDKTRQQWLTGIKSGEYTNANTINLFTDGQALEHPFIKKYNFQGFPQLLLIDKAGRIFSATMPRDGKEICAIIKTALKSTPESK